MRIDVYLYQNGYADSRAKAQTLIRDGAVYINAKQVTKSSFDVEDGACVEIRGEVLPYVSRGGYKLAAALDAFGVLPASLVCVDIGASTGGFTDCLLQRGAHHVFSVDSGTDQLSPTLRADARVTVMEKYNARNLVPEDIGGVCDMCVCDVSFISLAHIFAPVRRILKPYDASVGCGHFVALIKPQFEAGREHIGKGGIVRDEKVYLRVLTALIGTAATHGLFCKAVTCSPILGGDGNREFLAHFVKDAPAQEAHLDRMALQQLIKTK